MGLKTKLNKIQIKNLKIIKVTILKNLRLKVIIISKVKYVCNMRMNLHVLRKKIGFEINPSMLAKRCV